MEKMKPFKAEILGTLAACQHEKLIVGLLGRVLLTTHLIPKRPTYQRVCSTIITQITLRTIGYAVSQVYTTKLNQKSCVTSLFVCKISGLLM